MYHLFEAIDAIRQTAIAQTTPGAKSAKLWSTMVRQFAAQDGCCDGQLVDVLEGLIAAFVEQLNDESIIAMWKETETGLANEEDADRYFVFDLRHDVRMELLRELTKLAAEETRDKRRGPRGSIR